MEEKDIKIIENILKCTENILKPLPDDAPIELTEFQKHQKRNYTAIKNMYEAYKQNEKVIYKMADAMEDEHCGVKDIINEEICDHKRCIGTAMQCKNCIINYFRKKCE